MVIITIILRTNRRHPGIVKSSSSFALVPLLSYMTRSWNFTLSWPCTNVLVPVIVIPIFCNHYKTSYKFHHAWLGKNFDPADSITSTRLFGLVFVSLLLWLFKLIASHSHKGQRYVCIYTVHDEVIQIQFLYTWWCPMILSTRLFKYCFITYIDSTLMRHYYSIWIAALGD